MRAARALATTGGEVMAREGSGAQGAGGPVGLKGCAVVRPPAFGGAVEIVKAASACAFPTRVSEGLGACLKVGAAHAVTNNGARETYPAHAVCVRAPGSVWSSEAAPVAFLSIDVAPALLPRDLGARTMRYVRQGPRLDVPAFARRLAAHDALSAQGALAELLLALVELGGVEGGRSLADEAPVRAARERLASGLDGPLSLDELAGELGVDKFALIRQFRRRTGTTPYQYRLMVRVERARALLARGVPPAEAAFELGFVDQPHLSRAFKRLVGVTPGAYARDARRFARPPAP